MAETNDKFLSKYNEIIFENLDSILRQNMMFQTQISFLEEAVKDKEQLEKNLYAKESEIDLTSELAHLKSELKDKEEILAISGDGSPDAHRLQNALNTQMKDATVRKRQIENLESEKIVDKKTISEQRKYIQKLEKMLPKEKKIRILPKTVPKVVAKKVVAKNVVKKNKVKEDRFDLIMKSDEDVSSGGTF